MKIGCMIWRIGGMLDFFEQLTWVRAQGFEEVSFWSFAGDTDKWRGFDLITASASEFARLKRALVKFQEVDIHAPAAPWSDLDIGLTASDATARDKAIQKLRKLLDRAAECGAKVVTLHGEPEKGVSASEWRERMAESLVWADALARAAGVRIGMEFTAAYGLLTAPHLTHTGLTVDTGHMQFGGGAGYREYGSMSALIECIGPRVFHVHIHDYDGKSDHLPIGQGNINFEEIFSALRKIGYNGSLCLELNPEIVGPEGILESRERLKTMLKKEG